MVGGRGRIATGAALRKGARMDAATGSAQVREPRTERGRRTQRAILDAAAAEFGEKGFHDSSIVSITIRAGVALGSFYTYFESKEALFKALVADMSGRVRDHVAPALSRHDGGAIAAEGIALEAFLVFAREHKEIYRIIDEAEFVAPEDWRAHYLNTAARILERLQAAVNQYIGTFGMKGCFFTNDCQSTFPVNLIDKVMSVHTFTDRSKEYIILLNQTGVHDYSCSFLLGAVFRIEPTTASLCNINQRHVFHGMSPGYTV